MFDFIFCLLPGVLTYTSPRLFWAPGVDLMGCLPITNWENSLEFYLAVCLSICLSFCLPIHPPTHPRITLFHFLYSLLLQGARVTSDLYRQASWFVISGEFSSMMPHIVTSCSSSPFVCLPFPLLVSLPLPLQSFESLGHSPSPPIPYPYPQGYLP